MRTIVPEFDVMEPGIDEKSIRNRNPQVLTSELAIAKSRALRPKVDGPAILITSDQVVTYNGAIREKPVTRMQAKQFLESYRDGPATCVTAVLGWNSVTGEEDLVVDEAKVWFKDLTDDAIDDIVRAGIIFDCAGGFAAGHPSFEPYIDRISGEMESVIGLPKALTTAMIASLSGEA